MSFRKDNHHDFWRDSESIKILFYFQPFNSRMFVARNVKERVYIMLLNVLQYLPTPIVCRFRSCELLQIRENSYKRGIIILRASLLFPLASLSWSHLAEYFISHGKYPKHDWKAYNVWIHFGPRNPPRIRKANRKQDFRSENGTRPIFLLSVKLSY